MTTASELQAAFAEKARLESREARLLAGQQRQRWALGTVDDLNNYDALTKLEGGGIEISGDHRPRPAREWMRPLSAVERLVGQWNATPDYAPTDYDRGRVDQRHAMTEQLLEALEADDGDDE